MQNLFMRIIKTDRFLLNIAKTVQDFPPLSLFRKKPSCFAANSKRSHLSSDRINKTLTVQYVNFKEHRIGKSAIINSAINNTHSPIFAIRSLNSLGCPNGLL